MGWDLVWRGLARNAVMKLRVCANPVVWEGRGCDFLCGGGGGGGGGILHTFNQRLSLASLSPTPFDWIGLDWIGFRVRGPARTNERKKERNAVTILHCPVLHKEKERKKERKKASHS